MPTRQAERDPTFIRRLSRLNHGKAVHAGTASLPHQGPWISPVVLQVPEIQAAFRPGFLEGAFEPRALFGDFVGLSYG